MDTTTILMTLSAAILLFLGLAHLLYTFWGPKLLPRDPRLVESMQSTHLVITKETTVWKAWLGFNASHSMAAILFGLVFGYLAISQPTVLYGSVFLQVVGFCMLAGWLVLGRLYWFSVPFTGTAISWLCYVPSILLAYA
jgi:hypothetical protein